MGDFYVFDFGDDAGREDRQAERTAERLRLRERYAGHLVESMQFDSPDAGRVVAALFDHAHSDGSECHCSCHPRLSALHDDGFDCPCTWDEARRAEEHRSPTAWFDSPGARAMSRQHEQEGREIAEWLTGQRDVEATRTTTFAPEQWEGTVDGRSFYFRERHGEWRLELDLEPTGRFANRLVRVEDGEMVTEPVPLVEGTVIAEGIEGQLGGGPVEHIEFIVRTIRDRVWGESCDHAGALFYCPLCGKRMQRP